MKIRITGVLIFAVMLIFALTACGGANNNTGNGNSTTPPSDKGDNTAAGTYNRLVYAGNVTAEDINDIRVEIFNSIYSISVVADSESAADGEIVFGDSGRAITAAAKAKLQEELAADGKECGYIIYSDGKNVAVYWTENDMKNIILPIFLDECVKERKLVFENSGTVLSACYTYIDYEQQKDWMAIEAAGCDADIIAKLKELDALFNGPYMIEWFANLWDQENGGFYFSNSARDNEPFLPDLESTYQLTSMLKSSGASGGLSKNNFFPNEMKIKMVEFAKAMQSPQHGYFLHPQWSQDINALETDRVGRDLQWATDILKFTVDTDGDGEEERVYPNYCTPAGLKCENHSINGGQCDYSVYTVSSYSPLSGVSSAGLTVSLSESVSSAVSRVADSSYVSATAVSSKPDFSSSEAFKQWVIDYSGGIEGFMDHSGEKHNLNAFQTEIYGNGFGDEMTEVLMEIQKTIWDYQEEHGMEQTGVWQLEADLSAVAGIHKYMPFINSKDTGATLDLNVAKAMVKTCLTVINTPLEELEGGSSSMCMLNDLMNMWTGINHAINNIKNAYGEDSAEVEELYDVIRAGAVSAIDNAITSLNHYSLGNGLFVFTYGRRSLTKMYGCPASMGVEEADVNGMLMMLNMRSVVFSVLGYGSVNLCTAADGEKFLDTVQNLEPIEKIPIPEARYEDFETEDISSLQASNYITTSVNSNDFKLDIVPDDETGSNVLYFKSGLGSASNNQADSVHFTASGTGNCNVAEFDFRLVSVSQDSHVFQFTMGSSAMFIMYKSGDYLTVSAITSTNVALGSEKLVTAAHKVRADEWHKIRIEAYDPEEGETKPVIKLYVDEEYIATTNMFMGSSNSSKSYDSTYSKFTVYSCAPVVTELHLDNVYMAREYLDLEVEE